MLSRLILLIACLTACSPAAQARRITYDCDLVFDAIGHARHQTITVDTDHGVILHDDVTWLNGMKNPLDPKLQEWVHVGDKVVSWGNRHPGQGESTSTFELDLQTGRYTATSPKSGQFSHGVCSSPSTVS